ncbi:unnamed protein product [Rotaria sp. Silwood2]|nr:unnamed protein product [Rotaria sp. Silwood2]
MFEKSLQIRLKIFPSNHPDIAVSYINISGVYDSPHDYDKSIEYLKKAFEIQLHSLSPNHSHFATTYNSLTLPSDHPHIATSYTNMSQVYSALGEHEKAIDYLNKALAILLNSLSSYPLL